MVPSSSCCSVVVIWIRFPPPPSSLVVPFSPVLPRRRRMVPSSYSPVLVRFSGDQVVPSSSLVTPPIPAPVVVSGDPLPCSLLLLTLLSSSCGPVPPPLTPGGALNYFLPLFCRRHMVPCLCLVPLPSSLVGPVLLLPRRCRRVVPSSFSLIVVVRWSGD